MTLTAQAVLADLDSRLPEASESWRSTAMRQVVDLLLSGAQFYTAPQIALFDEVIGRLIENADRLQLAELSNRLAPLANAPVKVIGRLARHADVAISGPILAQSTALTDNDLVEIADKDRIDSNLLMKIVLRPLLSPAVTDAMLTRGNKAVQRAVVDHPNARISEAGFARVIMGIAGDKDFAAAIAARDDVPRELRLWLANTLNE